MRYPWLKESFSQLSHDYDNAHHAHLFCGHPGIGKTQYAFAYAKLQLCQQPNAHAQGSEACGECQNCRLFEAGTHPDLHVICSEYYFETGALEQYAQYAQRYFDATARQKRSAPGQFISVDQIRQLAVQFANKPHISNRKVAIIAPADSMNVNAANALLKLLEEPPAESLLLLISAQPGMLLATIRSRCLLHRLPAPDASDAVNWLKQQGVDDEQIGVFETASPVLLWKQWQNGELSIRSDIREVIKAVFSGKTSALQAASELAKVDFAQIVVEFETFAHVMIKTILAKSNTATVNNFTAQDIYYLYDKVIYYRKLQKESINKQLALETLFSALENPATYRRI